MTDSLNHNNLLRLTKQNEKLTLECYSFDQHYTELRLSKRDRVLATRMLDSSRLQRDEDHHTRQDLQRMLMLNMKAEIQILEQHDLVDSVVSLIKPFRGEVDDA